MYCKKCGTKIPEGAVYCPKCTTKVNGTNTSGARKNSQNGRYAARRASIVIAAATACLLVTCVTVLLIRLFSSASGGKERLGYRESTPKNTETALLPTEETTTGSIARETSGSEKSDPAESLPVQAEWSQWQDNLPTYVTTASYEIEEQTLYSTRERKTTSSTTKSNMDGWELYDTVEGDGSWGVWSDWSENPVNSTNERDVKTRATYRYRDMKTTESSASVLSGWTQYGVNYSWGSYGSWSGWSTNAVSGNESREVQTKEQYRYRTISTSTVYTDWGNWSAWQNDAVSGSDLQQVETRTVYGYYYYECPNCGAHMHGWDITCPTWAGGCGKVTIPTSSWREVWSTTPHSSVNFQDWHGTGMYYAYVDNTLVFRWDSAIADGRAIRTQYRYRTRSTTEKKTYSDWTSWGDTVYFPSSTRDVESRTMYRYRDRQKKATYLFWKWGDWSAWSTNAVYDSAEREVQTRTEYAYRDRVHTTTYYFRRWTEWSEYTVVAAQKSDMLDVRTKVQYRFRSK